MLALGFYFSSFLPFMLKCSQYIGFHFALFLAMCFQDDLGSWDFSLSFFLEQKHMYLEPIKISAPKKWQGAFLVIRQSYKVSAQWDGHSRSIEIRTRHSLKVPETFVMTHWWNTNQNGRARYNAFHIERFTLHDMRFWWYILGCWFRIGLPKCAVRVPNRNARDEILGSEVLLVYPWVLI